MLVNERTIKTSRCWPFCRYCVPVHHNNSLLFSLYDDTLTLSYNWSHCYIYRQTPYIYCSAMFCLLRSCLCLAANWGSHWFLTALQHVRMCPSFIDSVPWLLSVQCIYVAFEGYPYFHFLEWWYGKNSADFSQYTLDVHWNSRSIFTMRCYAEPWQVILSVCLSVLPSVCIL